MKTAFKEWAVICKALTQGEQILILRKGGIVETGGEFRLEHPQFLLFPTYSHQSADSLVPSAQHLLDNIDAGMPETGEVVFRHYAAVTDSLRIHSLGELLRFRGYHVWSDEVVEERFHRWHDALYVLIVRVFSLAESVTVPLREDYTGCKSWVDLEDDINVEGAQPVISDEAFSRRVREIGYSTSNNRSMTTGR